MTVESPGTCDSQKMAWLRIFVSRRRRHTTFGCDWSSDVCSSDLVDADGEQLRAEPTVGCSVDPGELRVADACVGVGQRVSPACPPSPADSYPDVVVGLDVSRVDRKSVV